MVAKSAFIVIFDFDPYVSHKPLAIQRFNKPIQTVMHYFKHRMAFYLISHLAFFLSPRNILIIDFKAKGRFLFCIV